MSQSTTIEWTDATWNPTRGCSRVSEGCRFCYAEAMAARFSDQAKWGHGFAERTPSGPRWTGKVELVEEKLKEPLRWRKPRRVFVNSTSDLFHESLGDGDIARVMRVIRQSTQHTFQVLTKRSARMRDFILGTPAWEPPPNLWLGVSVEDQRTAYERIPVLLDTPAAVRFVSAEPLLGPVSMRNQWGPDWLDGWDVRPVHASGCDGSCRNCPEPEQFPLPAKIDWVIVGGESGPQARRCGADWIRSVVDQCKDAGVPCFVKQLGANVYDMDRIRLRSEKGGDPAEWPEDLRVREFPDPSTRTARR